MLYHLLLGSDIIITLFNDDISTLVILYVAYSYIGFKMPCGHPVSHVARRLLPRFRINLVSTRRWPDVVLTMVLRHRRAVILLDGGRCKNEMK